MVVFPIRRLTYGFTLIELSVVLVIIGLVAGGILIGRELTNSAQIRSTISQKQKFDSAVNAFKIKYGQLPGDMQPIIASQLGFFTFTNASAGATNYGDNDGFITSALTPACGGEPLVYWRHLSEAQLIDGQFSISSSNALDAAGVLPSTATDPALSLPQAKLGNNLFWTIDTLYSQSGYLRNSGKANVYLLTGVRFMFGFGQVNCGINFSMSTPEQAYAIDSKLDDGFPHTGNIQYPAGAMPTYYNSTTASGYCSVGGTSRTDPAAVYNIKYGNVQACPLVLKAQ